MIGTHFAGELEAAGLLGLPFSWGPDGVAECWDARGLRVRLRKGPGGVTEERLELPGAGEGLAEERIAALRAALGAHDPAPILFQGGEVSSAADVDRATTRRIAGYLAPQWEGDPFMQTRALLRQLEDVAAARDALEDPGSTQAQKDQAGALLAAARAKRAQVLAYRQEGESFKAARGW